MNCQAGDLAIIIKGHPPENVGALVRVIRAARRDAYVDDGWPAGHLWVIELLRLNPKGSVCYNAATGERTTVGAVDVDPKLPILAFDDCLRPIRPGEDPDAIDTPAPVDAVTA